MVGINRPSPPGLGILKIGGFAYPAPDGHVRHSYGYMEYLGPALNLLNTESATKNLPRFFLIPLETDPGIVQQGNSI
jgi:hypothetical protein